MTVLTFSEVEDTAFELIAKGRELADAMGTSVVAVAGPSATMADKMGSRGADRVLVPSGLPEGAPVAETYAAVLQRAASETGARVVLVGSTRWGKEVASRLAGLLGCGCALDCSSVSLSPEKSLIVQRLVLGGNAISTEIFTRFPAIVGIPPRVVTCLPEGAYRGGAPELFRVEVDNPRVQRIRSSKRELAGVRLETAQLIVSVGRGVKSQEDIKLVRELASALHGELGCSRPIAVDLKWLPKEHWVGLSGTKVRPRVYIACGISGQIQHLAGMRDSGLIVAINKDKDAPIFKAADYGIVGDMYQVIPELVKELSSCRLV
ncbi:MAG: electron transfer flavoprotein subunit alpha/FixB family protein [Thermoplasmata archaeon]